MAGRPPRRRLLTPARRSTCYERTITDVPYRPLTVAGVLEAPALQDARVVAGARGLRRPVRTVGVLDVEDLERVRADQLVLSSAYPLLSLDLGGLIERLALASIAALGIKTDGFWDRMPAELSVAAESLDLPLLRLPPGPFDDLVNPLLTAIAERQAEGLRRVAELHTALTSAILDATEIGSIAGTVARALGCPTAILDERGDLLAHAGDDGSWAGEYLLDAAAGMDELGAVQVDEQECLVAPISAFGRIDGAICVLGAGSEDAFARSAVARAAVVSGMLLLGHRRLESVHRRFERELLDDLVDLRLRDPEQALERARRIGWPQRHPYLVLVVGRRRPGAGGLTVGLEVGLDENALASFSRALRGVGQPTRSFLRRPGLCVVVHLTHEPDAMGAAAAILDRLTAAVKEPWVEDALVAGVARPRTDLLELAAAFREAVLSLATSPRVRTGTARIAHFSELGAARLAAQVRDPDLLGGMASDALGPLADPSLPHRDELLETLAVLLDHNMSIAETAGELFFHYNTVRHRLRRLRELLGERLTTLDGRVSLGLAIAALRVREADRELLRPGYARVEAASAAIR